MDCPLCKCPLGWESDHNSEDYGFDEGGAVLVYSCHNDGCDADMVTIYVN
jgi:hypothetical protein